MKIISLIWGILAILGMLLGFIPCLGAYNWINIPFAAIGLIVSIIAAVGSDKESSNSAAISGIVLCSIAVVFGIIRLSLGGGIF